MTASPVDFDAMSAEDRLTFIHCLLGDVAPDDPDLQACCVSVVFSVACGLGIERVAVALGRLERARPGYLDSVLVEAADVYGVRFPEVQR